MTGSFVASAPGRLDVLGGVADYSGALVLETPTQAETAVDVSAGLDTGAVELVADGHEGTAVGLDFVRGVASPEVPYPEVRAALDDARVPTWARYPLGCLVVLARHGVVPAPHRGMRLAVRSDVPTSMGVSSSAALEVATMLALLGAAECREIDPLRVAFLAQEAENRVVGAPCGVMDQVTVACGQRGALLPILCRPATLGPLVPLPSGAVAVGWPSGASHDVAGDPYGRARAATFMGKRMVEAATGTIVEHPSDLPHDVVLPESVLGAEFLDRHGAVPDDLSSVEAGVEYPVAAAVAFAVGEHVRTQEAVGLLRRGGHRTAVLAELGALLAASHDGYRALGLGHPATDAIAAAVRQAGPAAGCWGARSSGGGSGGTVVVLCDESAVPGLEELAGVPLVR